MKRKLVLGDQKFVHCLKKQDSYLFEVILCQIVQKRGRDLVSILSPGLCPLNLESVYARIHGILFV